MRIWNVCVFIEQHWQIFAHDLTRDEAEELQSILEYQTGMAACVHLKYVIPEG